MNTNTLDEKTLHHISTYGFNKITLDDAAQWVADCASKGLKVGQWLDGFRVHDQNRSDIPEIETLWQAISFFQDQGLDYLVIGNTAYQIPEDAKKYIPLIKENKLETLPDLQLLSPYTLNILGKHLTDLGSMTDATTCFSEALKINPYLAEAYNNLGQLLWKVGRQKDAYTLFAESLSKNPHLLTTQLNFFESGMELEEYASMLHVIQYLEEEIPSCHEFKHYRAICLHHLGENEKAKNILEDIIKKSPNDDEAKQLLQNYL